MKAGQCPDPQDHFTHVFIDETIQTTEPESVIAKAGLIYSKGQVVMAGDPKQLGPFIRSSEGVKHGLNISLLQRLMELLTIPKALYYDNELDTCADEVGQLTVREVLMIIFCLEDG